MNGPISEMQNSCLTHIHLALKGMLENFSENDFKIVDTVRGKTKESEGFLGNCQFLSGVFQAISVLSQYNVTFDIQPDVSAKIITLLSDLNAEFEKAVAKFNPVLLNAMPYADIEDGVAEAHDTEGSTTRYYTESLGWSLSVFTLARNIMIRADDILKFNAKLKKDTTENLIKCILEVRNYQSRAGWGWSRGIDPSIYYTYTVLISIDDLADYVYNESDLQNFSKDNEFIELFKQKTKKELDITIDEIRAQAKFYILTLDDLLDKELGNPSPDFIKSIYERLYLLSSIYFSGADQTMSETETSERQIHFAGKILPIYDAIYDLANNEDNKKLWDSESDYRLSLTSPVPDEVIKQFNSLNDPGILCLLINVTSYYSRITESEILDLMQLQSVQDILISDAIASDASMYWYYPGYSKKPYCLWYTVSAIEALISIVDLIESWPDKEKAFDASTLSEEAIDELLGNENIKSHIKERFFNALFSEHHFATVATKELSESPTEDGFNRKPQTYEVPVIDEVYEIFDDIYNLIKGGGKSNNDQIDTCKENLSNSIIKVVGKNLDLIISEYINKLASDVLKGSNRDLSKDIAAPFFEDLESTVRKIIFYMDRYENEFKLENLLTHIVEESAHLKHS